MGLGSSRVDSETLHERKLFVNRFVTLPHFIGESVWHNTDKNFEHVENMLKEGTTNDETNGNIAPNGPENIYDGIRRPLSSSMSTFNSTPTNKSDPGTFITAKGGPGGGGGGACQQSGPRPSRRHLIPPATIQFRDSHCCKVPCRPFRATLLEPDSVEARGGNGTLITLEDSEGTLVLPPFRQWQIFPGNNRFFCDGWIITGSDKWIFYLSFILLNLVFVLFAGVIWTLHEERACTVAIIIGVTGLVLYFYCVSTMLYCALTDPGIIPRSTRSEVEAFMKLNPSVRHPQGVEPYIRERVNGKEIIRRWCPTCLLYKPPRATHCRICNNCIERFDHHCPFLGNCVGQRNYPTFFAFLFAIVISGIFILSVCVFVVYTKLTRSKNMALTMSTWEVILSSVVGILALASTIPVMILLYMHIDMVLSEVTTNEDIKRAYGNHNPFDTESKLKNCKIVLFSPRIPSLIMRTEFVTRDWLANVEYFDSVQIALLKRFGRRTNSSSTLNSSAITSQDATRIKPREILRDNNDMQSHAKKSFVFLHNKSEPDIARNETNNNSDDVTVDYKGKWIGNGDGGHVQIKRRSDTRINMEQLEYAPPTWDMGNLLVRKGRLLRNCYSEYDFGSGHRNCCLDGWNNNQRIGPSYERQYISSTVITITNNKNSN
ncbi:uncharacterized protein LOC110852109 [Folsomia candida]|uniref:uncharacterized protein LOC110852109 n=1 Tax=Folsomia candida TaxID=158441 RepID=UPI0016051DC9|nr:uncharacterized protein LOC110852109 [Folsomia candida]